MGICSSLSEDEKNAIKSSNTWDSQLQSEAKVEQRVIKLLLLGTGESGKSTIFKQMQILYEDGFGEIEKATFRHVIRRNCVEAMQTLISAARKWNYDFSKQESGNAAQFIGNVDTHNSEFWTPRIMEAIHILWPNEPAISHAFANRAKLQLLDSAEYLFKNVDRMGQTNYVPSADDILRARLRTSGIVERVFKVHNVAFKFLDVGGQRNERRKWIHCFEEVTSVIFVAAISEYDQVLYEDSNANRLKESIKVFGDICSHDAFDQTAFILFLNKIDLLADKVGVVPFTTYYPEYDGDNTVEQVGKFIEEQFRSAVTKDKLIFAHLTCATDTKNVERVFDACKMVIIKENLKHLGLS